MAINFPDSPNDGDIYTVNGKKWIYGGGKWASYGLAIAPDVLKVDSVNNRVGVNNLSPSVDLDVTGNAAVSGSLTVDGDLTISGNTTTLNTTELYVEDNKVTLNSGATGSATANAGIEVERGDDPNVEILWDESVDAWKIATDFTVDTDTLHVDSTNNRVGIGTTTPSTLLHVGDTTVSDNIVTVTAANNTSAGVDLMGDLSGAKGFRVKYEGNGNYFAVEDNTSGVQTERLRIDASGNVGIGTTTPSSKVDVYTDVAAGVPYPLTLSAKNSSGTKKDYVRVGFGIEQGAVGIEASGFRVQTLRNGAITNAVDFSGATGAQTWNYYTEGVSRMTIASSGNVGINDTTPSYTLDVNGDINATGNVRVSGAPVGKVLVYEGTIGSGVSSFTASNVFSSAYDNYEVILSGMDCSIDGVVLGLRLGSSTTTYNYGGYYIIYSTGSSGFFGSTTETSWGVGYTDTRGVTCFVAQILGPNIAKRTKFTAVSPGNNVQRSVAGEHSSNTAHTSFTLLPSSGTMTGGVLRVYGYVEV